MTNKYKCILMVVFACFLILLNAVLLERERRWGSGSLKQYCFVSDHTSNIDTTLDKYLHLLQRKEQVQNVSIFLKFSVFSSLTRQGRNSTQIPNHL
jgi:hypothetical protein